MIDKNKISELRELEEKARMKTKPVGWRKEPKKHSDAARKGWRNRGKRHSDATRMETKEKIVEDPKTGKRYINDGSEYVEEVYGECQSCGAEFGEEAEGWDSCPKCGAKW